MVLRSSKGKDSTKTPTRMVLRSLKVKSEKPVTKKRKRRDSDDLGPLKITGVIDDCLEHVFGYLNATDLANVDQAHPNLVAAARVVFKQKYGNKLIKISDSGGTLAVHKMSQIGYRG